MSAAKVPTFDEPEKVIATHTPGLVLWRYPRRTFTVKGETWRARTYSLTHEPSGFALLAGLRSGTVKAIPSLALGQKMARQLGDVRWRGKPFDWTQPVEVVQDNDRARMACLILAGFLLVLDHYDNETKKWAARNDIDLSLPSRRPTEQAASL